MESAIKQEIALEREKADAEEQVQVGGAVKDEIKSVDLFVTEECNMNCSYCFHPKGEQKLDIVQAKKIIDRLKIISPNNMVITFFGGEPLLYPNLVLDIARYARTVWPADKTGERVGFHIVTNGTYFNEDMFKRYKMLNFSIQVSIDGDRITTMEGRGGNFDAVVNNIKEMLKIYPDLSARMTYTPATVGRLAINIKFVHSLGIIRIMHHAVMEADWNEEAISQYAYQLNNLYHYRRYMNRIGNKLELLFIDKTLKVINDELPAETDFCQAGKSYLAILPNGDIYPCHRAASKRVFKLGNIFNEKRPFVRGMFLNIDKEFTGCTFKCQASRTCHSCPVTHYLVNKDMSKPISSYCEVCKVENNQALQFLPVELSDRRERQMNAMSAVIADIAEETFRRKNVFGLGFLFKRNKKNRQSRVR